jgi:hypothetical protein
MKKNKFKPRVCECCKQTENYLLGLDKGSAKIVLKILYAIGEKGVNEIHPSKEMDLTIEDAWFLTNLSRPRFHGLIAYVDEENKPGYYCLTRKAGKFLKNYPVPRNAIISKVTGHQEGYYDIQETVTINELLGEDINWEGKSEYSKRGLDIVDNLENQMPTLF